MYVKELSVKDPGGVDLVDTTRGASPQPTPPPTQKATPVASDADEESDSRVASDGDIADDLTGPDKTALAPAPSPAFLPGEGGQDVLPPGRATLLPIPAVVPCELRVPVPAISKQPAVVGPENSDDEPMFVDTGLTNQSSCSSGHGTNPRLNAGRWL